MEDNEILMNAIDNYDAYTPKQRELLKIIVGISVNDVAIITPSKLIELLNSTKPTVYSALARFKEDGIIINQNEHKYTYKLNPHKLADIIIGHKKKLEFFEKKL